MIALALAAALAIGTPDVAQLGWLAGSWVQSTPGALARETWLAPRDGIMAGVNQSNQSGKSAFVEFMTIRATSRG